MSSSSTVKRQPCRRRCAGHPAPPATRARPDMRVPAIHLLVATCLISWAVGGQAAMDPNNPSCPKDLNWSTYPVMRFTLDTSKGGRVLRAEGQIDEDTPARLQEALETNKPSDEIWLRSPGGDARAGNAAGKI